MSSPRLRLRDEVRLDLHYRDTTRFGSALTGLCDRLVRKVCGPIAGHLAHQQDPLRAEQSTQLMAQCLGPRALGALYERPDRLREDCLFPRPEAVFPAALGVSGPAVPQPASLIPLPPDSAPELARWIGEWSQPSRPPRHAAARALWDALSERAALTSEDAPEPRRGDGITFVGHATVSIERDDTRLLFDPFLLPPAGNADDGQRPLYAAELCPHAVFITHSHPDHYDVGSLLRLGADTPIYVPVVERESLLSIDMATRLRALGFRRVSTLAWGRSVCVGPHRVHAHPFWGEQPTDGEFLHPEARNCGNVYVVDSAGVRVALVADAGRDHGGSTVALARQLRHVHGPIDVLAGGYRAWRLLPIRYLGTSVARYLLSVPRDQWGRRMQLMNDADDLMEMAIRWGAKVVLPYANGGAPWYWERGLGPRPGSTDDDPDFDPSADALVEARRRRLGGPQPVPSLAWLQPAQRLALRPPATAAASFPASA